MEAVGGGRGLVAGGAQERYSRVGKLSQAFSVRFAACGEYNPRH